MMPNVPRDEYGIPTNIVRVKKPASNTKRGRTNKRFVVADNNINDNTTNDNISSSNSNSNMNINNIVNEGDGSNGNGGSTVDNMSPRPVIDEIETKHYTQMVFKTSYDKNWSAEDAFRELAGGWRDRVLDAAGLSLLQLRIFRLPLIETHDIVTIVYVALQAGDVEYDGNNCLGYIRYSCKATATDTQGGREFVNGVVDIVNAEATLHPWPTSPEAATADAINESGFPTSDNAKATLRYRGEHLLSSFHALRHHNIHCMWGGIHWSGKFEKDLSSFKIDCARVPANYLGDLHRIATQNGTSSNLPFLPDPKQDVHIRMGGMGAHGRDSSHDGTGHAAQRQGVRREDFERWIKIALFPDSVQMATGDLLLSLPGQLYQQGLQVEIAPCDDGSRLRLGYGYNLVAGGPDHVLPQSIVMQQIWSIWEGAVAQQPELIQALHRMLLDNCVTCRSNTSKLGLVVTESPAEVSTAATNMSRSLAKTLWRFMRTLRNPKEAQPAEDATTITVATTATASAARTSVEQQSSRDSIWYYSHKECMARPEIAFLITAQGMRGVELNDTYWDVLRRHCNVWTFAEREYKTMESGTPVMLSARGSLVETAASRVIFTQLPANAGDCWMAYSYCEERQAGTFYINAEWCRLETAAALLRLVHPQSQKPIKSEMQVLYQTVKVLFTMALKRISLEKFALPTAPTGHGRHHGWQTNHPMQDSPYYRRWLCIERASIRVRNYLSLQGAVVVPEAIPGQSSALRIYWNTNLYMSEGRDIAIQCHHSSCPIVQSSTCIRGPGPHPGRVLSKLMAAELLLPSQDCSPSSQSSGILRGPFGPCRTVRTSSLFGHHIATDLVPGEQYLFLMVLDPNDRYAIVSATDLYTAPERIPAVVVDTQATAPPVPAPETVATTVPASVPSSVPDLGSSRPQDNGQNTSTALATEQENDTEPRTRDAETQTVFSDPHVIEIDDEQHTLGSESEVPPLDMDPFKFLLGDKRQFDMTGLEHLYDAINYDGSVNEHVAFVTLSVSEVLARKKKRLEQQRLEQQRETTRKRNAVRRSLEAGASASKRARQDTV